MTFPIERAVVRQWPVGSLVSLVSFLRSFLHPRYRDGFHISMQLYVFSSLIDAEERCFAFVTCVAIETSFSVDTAFGLRR